MVFIEELLPKALCSTLGWTDCPLGLLPSCSPETSLASVLGISFASLLNFLSPGSLLLAYFLMAQRCLWGAGGGVEIYSNNTLRKGEQEIFGLETVNPKMFLFHPYI